jgi:transposase InsO family protein
MGAGRGQRVRGNHELVAAATGRNDFEIKSGLR